MTTREQYAEVLAAHGTIPPAPDQIDWRCACGGWAGWLAQHRLHVADALAAALPDPEQADHDCAESRCPHGTQYGDLCDHVTLLVNADEPDPEQAVREALDKVERLVRHQFGVLHARATVAVLDEVREARP